MVSLALVACQGQGNDGGQPASATTTSLERYTVTGRFFIEGSAPDDFEEVEAARGAGVTCVGAGGYDDIEPGLEVTVRDEGDAVIGDGQLTGGFVVSQGCVFDFKVPNLPRSNFYKVKVGNRGEQNYSYDEMKAAGWSLNLSLG